MFISKLFPCLRCTQRVEHIYLAYKPECLLLEAMNYYYLAYKLCTWYLAYKPDCLQDGAGLGGRGIKGPHCLLHRAFGFTTLTCSTEGVAMIFVVGALRLPQLWAHKVFGVHKREQSDLCSFSLFSQQALCAGLLFPGNFAENFEYKKAIYTWWHKSKAEACELISDWYRLCSTACSGESSEKIISVKDVHKKKNFQQGKYQFITNLCNCSKPC